MTARMARFEVCNALPGTDIPGAHARRPGDAYRTGRPGRVEYSRFELDQRLDQFLEDTFPASDAISVMTFT
ncbi:MAG TPA: hypothetical protein VFL53_05195 [Pseudolabrys sp.]|nr:hypothetical protein [Pseudolabrys sp.]